MTNVWIIARHRYTFFVQVPYYKYPIAHISRVAGEIANVNIYICKRRYNDLSVRKYIKGEDEREKAMARKKEKKRKRIRARGIREKEKERENSKLNIKLHFAIGGSRRKREDPTRRNSVVVTKKASSKESYFSDIKLFAMCKIAPNITYYPRQNIAAQRATLR